LKNLDDFLQHHGIKGQKWGVIRNKVSSGVSKVTEKPRQHVGSIKRENSWAKKDTSKMTTKEIQGHANRAQLENDFKRLSSKKNIGSKKDKSDYLTRGKMSDADLRARVEHLRAKDNLSRNAAQATKKQRDLMKKVTDRAAPIALNYYIKGKIETSDILNAVQDPKGAMSKAQGEVVGKIIKSKLG
jgi:hypothetical protein